MGRIAFNIVSSEFVDGKIRVVTDHDGRNEFVYPDDKFSSLAELRAEIAASKTGESDRVVGRAGRVRAIARDLNIDVPDGMEVAK